MAAQHNLTNPNHLRMQSNDTLTLFSYNCQGMGIQKVTFMQNLFSTCNGGIIALQETLMLRSNSYKISNSFPEYDTFITPATKSNQQIKGGRPSGGLAILWKKNINFHSSSKPIISLKSNRVQGVLFAMPMKLSCC